MDLYKLIGKKNPVILDIGCNDGADTNRFCDMFPEGTVYAFEPDPRAIENFKSKNLPAILYRGVVSDQDGFIEFYQSNSDTGWDKSGSILPPKTLLENHTWIDFSNKIMVPSTRLDTFVLTHKIELIDFIWADVQGAEEKLILGGKDTFPYKVRYLYTEYSNEELYESAPTKERILELLPWYVMMEEFNTNKFGGDILLRNIKL